MRLLRPERRVSRCHERELVVIAVEFHAEAGQTSGLHPDAVEAGGRGDPADGPVDVVVPAGEEEHAPLPSGWCHGDVELELQPRARGAAILVYALPVLAFLLGGLLLFGKLRKWSRRGAEEADSTEPLDADPAAPGSADEAGDVSAADEEWLQKALAEE